MWIFLIYKIFTPCLLLLLFFWCYFSLSFFPSFCLVTGPWCWTMAAPHTLCPNTLGSTRSSRLLPSLWVPAASVLHRELSLSMMTRCCWVQRVFSCLQPSSTAFTGTGVYTSESPVKTGPIISDITELAQSNPVATEEWIEDRQVWDSLIGAMSQSRKTGQEIYLKHFILFSKTVVSHFFLEVL